MVADTQQSSAHAAHFTSAVYRRRAVQFTTAVCQRLPARTAHFSAALYNHSRHNETRRMAESYRCDNRSGKIGAQLLTDT